MMNKPKKLFGDHMVPQAAFSFYKITKQRIKRFWIKIECAMAEAYNLIIERNPEKILSKKTLHLFR